jgi:uncharacterized alpha-E superfamily protein
MLTPSKDGYVHTYYGTFKYNDIKPKHGVTNMLLDEYLQKSVDKQIDKFSKELTKVIESFKKSNAEEINKLSDAIKEIKLNVSDLRQHFLRMVQDNDLKFEIKITDKVKKGK